MGSKFTHLGNPRVNQNNKKSICTYTYIWLVTEVADKYLQYCTLTLWICVEQSLQIIATSRPIRHQQTRVFPLRSKQLCTRGQRSRATWGISRVRIPLRQSSSACHSTRHVGNGILHTHVRVRSWAYYFPQISHILLSKKLQ